MTKTIIFCADGTWGNANEMSAGNDAQANASGDKRVNSLTNVSMLFHLLQGVNITPDGVKEIEWSNGSHDKKILPTQIAKYVHGVGDGEEMGEKISDGMFGIGVTSRIANGYNYISEHYEIGDRIVLVGFSRGAYTVRALAGLIASEGLLTPELAKQNADSSDVAVKYNHAVRAWLRYRKKTNVSAISDLLDKVDELVSYHHWFAPPEMHHDAFVRVDEIAAVAVWDTVGAMGLPLYSWDGKKYDLFNFTNNTLSEKVKVGLHAVAIDERRMAFTPTLWDEAPNVTQHLFAGVHTDIGGGNADHSLSDVSLKWFVERLQAPDVGVLFDPIFPKSYSPNSCGKWHLELIEEMHLEYVYKAREFPDNMMLNASVDERRNNEAAKYFPKNLPKTTQNAPVAKALLQAAPLLTES